MGLLEKVYGSRIQRSILEQQEKKGEIPEYSFLCRFPVKFLFLFIFKRHREGIRERERNLIQHLSHHLLPPIQVSFLQERHRQ